MVYGKKIFSYGKTEIYYNSISVTMTTTLTRTRFKEEGDVRTPHPILQKYHKKFGHWYNTHFHAVVREGTVSSIKSCSYFWHFRYTLIVQMPDECNQLKRCKKSTSECLCHRCGWRYKMAPASSSLFKASASWLRSWWEFFIDFIVSYPK